MPSLSDYSPEIPEDFKQAMIGLARRWKGKSNYPKINNDILGCWASLINDWVENESVPLFIRRHRGNRGKHLIHNDTNRIKRQTK